MVIFFSLFCNESEIGIRLRGSKITDLCGKCLKIGIDMVYSGYRWVGLNKVVLISVKRDSMMMLGAVVPSNEMRRPSDFFFLLFFIVSVCANLLLFSSQSNLSKNFSTKTLSLWCFTAKFVACKLLLFGIDFNQQGVSLSYFDFDFNFSIWP